MADEKRKRSGRPMRDFRSYVEIGDNFGRVLDYLESTRELENTLILFIRDDGAEGAALGDIIVSWRLVRLATNYCRLWKERKLSDQLLRSITIIVLRIWETRTRSFGTVCLESMIPRISRIYLIKILSRSQMGVYSECTTARI